MPSQNGARRCSPVTRVLWLCAGWWLCAVSSGSAQPTALSPSFRVSSAPEGHQTEPAVAADARGNSVVVWTSAATRPLLETGPDGSGSGIYAQRFDAAGSPLGGELRVNGLTPGDQHSPAVAMAANGQFLVVWVSDLWLSGVVQTIWGRRFDAAGTPLGEDFVIGTAGRSETKPSLAMRPDGVALVVWAHSPERDVLDVVGRFLDATGSLGEPFGVTPSDPSSGPSYRYSPQAAFEPDGAAVIVWAEVPDTSLITDYARRFAPDGTALEDPVVIASDLDRFVGGPPAVAVGAGGTLVIWEDSSFVFWGRFLKPPGGGAGNRLRLFDANFGGQRPALAGDDLGYTLAQEDFVYETPRSYGALVGRRLGLDGRPKGHPFVIARDIGDQLGVHVEAPALASFSNQDFIAVWNNTQSVSADTGFTAFRGAVWGRRYALPPPGADPCRLEAGGNLVCDVQHDGSGRLQLGVAVPPAAIPLFGDLDRDGRDDLCWYSAGTFSCDTAHNGGAAELVMAFGGRRPAAPLIGDLNGDGRDDLCLFRHGSFLCDTAHDGGTAEVVVTFGHSVAAALFGDVDGDGD
ncbi:MAG TPA: VCBS repeat-containing protein, partial [Thermoanaerobaculia bacterium]|nr:VCBS repeat-containing protein [Thermoanaerobaculia bacterium]